MQIKTIHLDDPYIFKTWKFSGGEVGVRLLDESILDKKIRLFARINSSDDLMKLLLANECLDSCEHVELYLPYFPYSRQDRACSKGDSFSLKVMCELLETCHFTKIHTFDMHSEVIRKHLTTPLNLIDNVRFASQILSDQLPNIDYIVAPDAGALPKIIKLSDAMGGFPYISADKKRDSVTGNILGLKFPDGTPDLTGKNLLVLDDVADGAGTFLGLAQEAKNLGAAKLYLAVSHGIFSKGLDCIYEYYDQIFTTNSFRTQEQYDELFPDNGLVVWDLLSEIF